MYYSGKWFAVKIHEHSSLHHHISQYHDDLGARAYIYRNLCHKLLWVTDSAILWKFITWLDFCTCEMNIVTFIFLMISFFCALYNAGNKNCLLVSIVFSSDRFFYRPNSSSAYVSILAHTHGCKTGDRLFCRCRQHCS